MGVIKRNAASERYNRSSGSGGLSASVSPKRMISFNAPGMSSYRFTESKENKDYGTSPQFAESDMTKRYHQQLRRAEKNRPAGFNASDLTNSYLENLKNTEQERPVAFQSKYTQNITDLLDTIQNPQVFDLKSNDTYKQLYDNYRESYMSQGDRAMRDAQGAAAAMTGGYGSTYAMAAGQQAYDNYLERLNDNNINLYQMALNDYWQNRNDQYNQLNAVNSQDAVDYDRYRDKIRDWKDDRNYYANQYQQNYGNDYGRYRDTVNDWQADRAYYANQAQSSYGNDFNMYQSGLDQYNAELNRQQAQAQFEAQQALQREQAAQAQKNWQTEWDYRLAQDARRARQETRRNAGSGSGKGRGSRRKDQGETSPISRATYEKNYDYYLNNFENGAEIAKAYEEYTKANNQVKTGRSFTRSDGKKVDIHMWNPAVENWQNYLQNEKNGRAYTSRKKAVTGKLYTKR